MSEQNFIILILSLAFAVFAVSPCASTLGGLFVITALYGLKLGLAYEKDYRLKVLRDDVEKQLATLKDKMDSLVMRGQR